MDALDQALAGAAQGVRRTPEVEEALAAVLRDAEASAGMRPVAPSRRWARRRRRSVALLAGFLGVAGMGAGVGYAAGWLFPQPDGGSSWFDDQAAVHVDVRLPSGEECRASYLLVPDESQRAEATPAEWDELWKSAREILSDVDPATLDTAEVRERFRASAQAAQHRVDDESGVRGTAPEMTERDVRLGAPGAELDRLVRAGLEAQGLDASLLISAGGSRCEDDLTDSRPRGAAGA